MTRFKLGETIYLFRTASIFFEYDKKNVISLYPNKNISSIKQKYVELRLMIYFKKNLADKVIKIFFFALFSKILQKIPKQQSNQAKEIKSSQKFYLTTIISITLFYFMLNSEFMIESTHKINYLKVITFISKKNSNTIQSKQISVKNFQINKIIQIRNNLFVSLYKRRKTLYNAINFFSAYRKQSLLQ